LYFYTTFAGKYPLKDHIMSKTGYFNLDMAPHSLQCPKMSVDYPNWMTFKI